MSLRHANPVGAIYDRDKCEGNLFESEASESLADLKVAPYRPWRMFSSRQQSHATCKVAHHQVEDGSERIAVNRLLRSSCTALGSN